MRNAKARTNSTIVEAADARNVGTRVKKLRTGQGLTLEALADLSGVSRAMISKLERGEKNPTLVVAAKVAQALRGGCVGHLRIVPHGSGLGAGRKQT